MSSACRRVEAFPLQMRNYIVALCACVFIVLIAWIFEAKVSSFLLAIAIASFIGGSLSGYLTTALASLLFAYSLFQLHPRLTAHESLNWQFAVLIFAGCLLSEFAGRLKQVERKRVQSERDLQALIQSCPDPVLLLDGLDQIVGTNAVTVSTFGYDEAALLGRPVTTLIPGFSASARLPKDVEVVTSNGDRARVSAVWVHFGDKTSLFLRDVAEERRVEAELEASEEKLRLLVETIPGLVYVRNAQGKLQQVSRRVTEFNGVPLPQLLRDNGLSAMHPEDRPRIAELLEQSFPLGNPFTYEFRHRRADGIYRWFHASIQPLKNAEGSVIRWYTLLTDIEDRMAMETALRAMQTKVAEAARISTVTEITASVVHEISQPLSAIISNSQACLRYLSAETLNPGAIKAAVERTLSNGRDASQTVKNIRALFRRREPGNCPVDLRPVIDDVLLLHEAQIRDLAVKVSVSVDPALPAIPGDRLQIQQVLVNLVCNAIESMESNLDGPRELEIRACGNSDMVLTEVADRGNGLSDPDKVFDLFFTTKNTGMGMGLRICKTIVEAHQGRLWAEPRPDRGTRFLFSLPAA